jgi:replicative DNA helicase
LSISKNDVQLEADYIFLLIDNPQLIDICDTEDSDFYQLYYQTLFKILRKMRRDSSEISLQSVNIEMDKKGDGVSKLISEVSDSVLPSQFYVLSTRIKEMSVIREQAKIMEEYKDPAIVIEKMKELAPKLQTKKSTDLSEAFDEYMIQYEERKEGIGRGLITGFDLLDRKAPIEPGTLNILAARSSIGKSAFALTMARNVAEYGKRVLFVSAEMSIPRLLDRLLAMLSNIAADRFRKCSADQTVKLLQPDIDRLKNKLSFVYMPYGTSGDIARLVAKENAKEKLDLVVVDYLQYLRDRKKGSDNESIRIGNMTRNLKGVAGTTDTAILALSQVNRQSMNNEEGMPQLHQLRDSGAIEQDADTVLILNREERSDTLGKLVVAKNRNGESDIEIKLRFNPETTEYSEVSERIIPTPVNTGF